MKTKTKRRPVLSIPLGPFERLIQVGVMLGLAALIGISVWGFLVAPATVPTHFNVLGEPDSFGGKAFLLFLPLLGLLLSILLLVLGRFPHTYNYPWPITAENAPRQYVLARTLLFWINLIICWLLVFVQWAIVQTALARPLPGLLMSVVYGALALLLLSIVCYLVVAARAR